MTKLRRQRSERHFYSVTTHTNQPPVAHNCQIFQASPTRGSGGRMTLLPAAVFQDSPRLDNGADTRILAYPKSPNPRGARQPKGRKPDRWCCAKGGVGVPVHQGRRMHREINLVRRLLIRNLGDCAGIFLFERKLCPSSVTHAPKVTTKAASYCCNY